MATKLFMFDIYPLFLLKGIIDSDSNALKIALVTSSQVTSYSPWAISHAYILGDIVVPITDNGHRYICTVAGTSDTIEPTWPTDDEDTVEDNEVTWQEYGGALADETIWGDASANEVSNGDGYTTGGGVLSGVTVGYVGKTTTFDFSDYTWNSLTKTFRYAFIYASITLGGYVNPMIGYILFDDTPADLIMSGIDFVVRLNSEGFFVIEN